MNQLTLFRQLILHLVLLHLFTPALHTLCLSLQQLEEPAAVTGAHRSPNRLQSLTLWFRYVVHPGVRRRQDGRVEAHLPVVISGTSVVVVPRALDADGGSSSIA